MTATDLAVLYDYGYWVNRKLFPVLLQLSPEQFTQPVGGSYGSSAVTQFRIDFGTKF